MNQTEIPSGSILKNRYLVKHIISKGEITTTYSAYDRQQNNKVILKVLIFSDMAGWDKLELFEKEAGILKNMDHPGIPKYIDHFEEDFEQEKLYVIVQIKVKGDNLENLIKSGKKLILNEVLTVFLKLLNILEYIHSLHPPIIHRDINPKNIIMDSRYNVYLIDFNAVGSNINQDETEIFVGTPGFTALEQYKGRIMPGADMYSLGVTIIFLLSGKDPNDIELKGDKLNFKKYVNIPNYLAGLLDTMIEKNEEKRLNSAKEALASLAKNLPSELELPNKEKQPQKEQPVLDPDIDLNSKDEMGLTPLMVEVKHNRYDMARLMVENGADVNAKDNDGFSILGYAIKNNNEKIVKLLLKNEVNLNTKDNQGANVLIYAVNHNLIEMAKLLIRKEININHKDNSDKTALDYAVLENNKEMIKILIESGADLNNIDVEQPAVKEALGEPDPAINKQDNQGRTPLMLAIDSYEDDQAKVMISKGADLEIKDKKGRTALIYCVWHERLDLAKYLIEKGADMNCPDNKGMTALTWAFDRRYSKLARFMVEKGADVFVKDKQGNNLYFYATSKKTKNILKHAGLKF